MNVDANRTGAFVLTVLLAACSQRSGPAASTDSVAPPSPTSGTSQAAVDPASHGDPRLLGVWIPTTYVYGGKPHSIDDGLVIITPTYLIANAIYDLSETRKPKPDASANYGTYVIKAPGQLVMDQAMQLHWHSETDEGESVPNDGTFFHQNVPEEIHYEIDGDTLTFRFQVPGEQAWVLKRAAGETCSPRGA